MRFKNLITLLFICMCICIGCAQQKGYEGNWEGILPKSTSLSFDILVKRSDSQGYTLTMGNEEASFTQKMTFKNQNRLQTDIDGDIKVDIAITKDKTAMTGYIKSGIFMYHIHLNKADNAVYQVYKGVWNPIMVDNLKSKAMYLGVEVQQNGELAIYTFFGDQRFTGTWAGNFKKENNTISFQDYKTGLRFNAQLLEDTISLAIMLGQHTMTSIHFTRSDVDLSSLTTTNTKDRYTDPPQQLGDGWNTASTAVVGIDNTSLQKLIEDIQQKELPNTHSVLIAKEGKLVFESYFEGYNAVIPHDQRSASKSISSAMIGIAIYDTILTGVDQRLYELLPSEFQYTRDASKTKITLRDLLTMSSGLDVDGAASEESYQNSDQWLKTVLEADMKHPPGTYANYGSANPYLLGVVLDGQLTVSVENYMEKKLFAPLGITNYLIQTEHTRTTPYFGGGMYLTPRDMLKFGQLYLDKGRWEGKQVIPENWVKDSFKKYRRLQDVKDKNEYGYLWWHTEYKIHDVAIASIEARGAGGQYIFVLPALQSVVVITSGNFRNLKLLQQPEYILETYILPALMN